ncbi:hypothetical protein E8E12_001892 [Didymella heteroderae]|uniref:Uncharacterized protein n=1 Tax=Didymella heteroderae TaxID=1769908 RepID=A0A9P4WNK9_9PLEO|nr:hypothetical protein E8E12_001892 [Didymella heteroderae]
MSIHLGIFRVPWAQYSYISESVQRCMYSYSTIDLGTPYHDPASPLCHQSLRSSRTSNGTPTDNTMTHASHLSPDYFSHKPRSFLSLHTDFDEKLAASPQTPSHDRGRRQPRLVGYDQPALNAIPAPGPRVPRSRTLLRLLILIAVLVLVSFGWRCEAVGCKGRGGGALVGDYIGSTSSYVGGGSVVAGWGSPEGMNLSKIWDRPSWGGERQGGEKGQESSTLDAFKDDEMKDEIRDEEGELVGFAGVNDDGVVEWDDEDAEFGADLVNSEEGEAEGGRQVQGQGQEGEANGEQQGEVEFELYEAPLVATIDGASDQVTSLTEGAADDGADAVITQLDGVSDAQTGAKQDDHQVAESATLARKGSWLGTMDGLW